MKSDAWSGPWSGPGTALADMEEVLRTAIGLNPNVLIFPSKETAEKFIAKYPQFELHSDDGIYWTRV